MGAAVFLWALALLSAPASVISDPHYLVAFPAVIHHPRTEKFCVLLSTLPETVHIAVTLEMKAQNHTLLEKDVEKPGTFECTSFQVPAFVPTAVMSDLPSEEEEVARVHVLIRKGDSVSFEGRKKVLVHNSYIRHLIEPDKPVYKPGDTVKFRIVRLDEEFKAIEDEIPLIQLKDPNNNQIGQWANVKPQQGIVDLSFPLASEAPLGTYSIQPGDSARNYRYFQVEEYVLPKFEVLFELPPLVTTSDKQIQIKVFGRYTYGKPVRGNVRLKLSRDVYRYFAGQMYPPYGMFRIEKEYTGQTDKTGCASFTINATHLNISQAQYKSYIRVSAELEEEGTEVTHFGESSFSVVPRAAEVEFINLNPYYKRGFPYTGKMKFTVNTVPIKNQSVYLTVDVNEVETHFQYVTDENGEVHFSLDTTKWQNLISLRGRYSILNVTSDDAADFERVRNEAFKWLHPFYSESNSFLEIQSVDGRLPCEKDQEVLVDYILDRKELDPEADHVDFYYLVISKGRIVTSGQKQVPVGQDDTLKGKFSLSLSMSFELAPTARLLLFAVFDDGEVAADVEEFELDKCFKHKVTLDFSEEEELPGSKVSLQVGAAPGALCSLQAVDKSVILKKNTTLTPEQVYSHPYLYRTTIGARGFDYRLEDFEPYPCLPSAASLLTSEKQNRFLLAPWYQSEGDVYNLFKQLRMKLFTNTKVKKPVTCRPRFDISLYKNEGGGLRGTVGARSSAADFYTPQMEQNEDNPPLLSSPKPKKEEKAKPRTHFPETWIWDLIPVNEEGKAIHSVTVPDTITEWKASAFCVADVGFGLSQQASLRVFQPFFVDVVLPYSVIRGETFQLKVIVFNYLKDCIQVRVDLAESQQLEVKPCPTCRFTTCLCEDEAKTFSWNVTATELGHVNLSVTAEAEENHDLCGNQISVTPARGRSDTVVKSLLVKSEGALEEETHNVFLCSSGDQVAEDISLELPENVVKDSARATVTAIGDIMGTALNNIGVLIQRPSGCGEQNMAKFVPNIFVLRYLENTNQVTPEIKEKATEYMKAGYQRQLLYKHDDGSYSAFGKRDDQGNTWLTAFVVQTFSRARSYIYVDEKHIQDAVSWLGQHQLPSGCFRNVGRLFNNALKGCVDDEITLTAYVVASLLELRQEKNGAMIDAALLCLKRNLSSTDSAYSNALLAYVFTLAGDMETRQQLLGVLDKQADKSEGSISFLDTETTAYYLLAVISTPEVSVDNIKHASQIVRALAKPQNPYGGFQSTQDTVVALQALSRYAALTYHEVEGLTALVTSNQGFQHEFHVGKKNRLLLQQASLPNIPGQYKVEMSGNGCVYVQATLRYNCLPQEAKAFALEVETSPKECNQTSQKRFDITLQVSYTGNRQTSNMVLIEVNLLSGFIPVKTSLKRLENEPRVKKVEFDPEKIVIYLDWLDTDVLSYSLSVEQEVEVTGLKPAIVKMYDYYHPDDSVVADYNAPCSTESTDEDSH